jgi:polyketide synthase PksJ
MDLVTALISHKNSNNGINFIENEHIENFVSYSKLYDSALLLLKNIQQNGVKSGDEVILQLQNNENFVISFWACLMGGIIPVPLAISHNDEHHLKILKVWNFLNNPYIISDNNILPKLQKFIHKTQYNLQFYQVVITISQKCFSYKQLTQPTNSKLNDVNLITADLDNIAFIQFSSGSTGDPKGVKITHRNLEANIEAMNTRSKHLENNDIFLSWMPLTHDLGVIFFHLLPLYFGLNHNLISTQSFIRCPLIWLGKANKYRTTILGSPNFGYKYFLNYFENHLDIAENWDLSCIKLILNGAEPISSALSKVFLKKLHNYGLENDVIFPAYGLAEATLVVTCINPQEKNNIFDLDRNYLSIGEKIKIVEPNNSNLIQFIDVGSSINCVKINIRDEQKNLLLDNTIGIIYVKGISVTSGYYNNNQATKEILSNNGWLNTGDLGFIHNGHLIVTGRAKDIIFVNGVNYYPHDIERLAENIEYIKLNKIAVCGVYNPTKGEDECIVFVVFKKKLDQFVSLAIEIKKYVMQKIGINVTHCIPIIRIPKTTSGKIQRFQLAKRYSFGEFDEIITNLSILIKNYHIENIVEPRNETEKILALILNKEQSEQSRNNKVGIYNNFLFLGLDSLSLTNIAMEIQQQFNQDIALNILFEKPTIAELAEYIISNNDKNKLLSYEDKVTPYFYNYDIPLCPNNNDLYPLSYTQHQLWMMSKLMPSVPLYNEPLVINFHGKMRVSAIQKSFNLIVERHEILRTVFVVKDDIPYQTILEHRKVRVPIEDFAYDPFIRNVEDKVLEIAADEAKRMFNLRDGPLIHVKLICVNKNDFRLVIVVHHLLIDGISLSKVFIKELEESYYNFSLPIEQRKSIPAALDIQYKDYAYNEVNNEVKRKKEKLEYWRKQLENLTILNLPTKKIKQNKLDFAGAVYDFQLPKSHSEALKKLSQHENVSLFMLLLTIFKI